MNEDIMNQVIQEFALENANQRIIIAKLKNKVAELEAEKFMGQQEQQEEK